MDMQFSPHLEIETFPRVVFTSDTTWDPSIADLEYIVEEMDILDDDHSPSIGQFDVHKYGKFQSRKCSNHLPSATNDSRRDAYIEDYINKRRSVDWMLASRFQII
jgi:hypothetical protein